jgi:hypothetical protein
MSHLLVASRLWESVGEAVRQLVLLLVVVGRTQDIVVLHETSVRKCLNITHHSEMILDNHM